MKPGFSIIIPAHNEGAVIEQTLRSVLANRWDRPLQLIIVANGCSDDTAARARALGEPVEVMEVEAGNKTNALNVGDRAARYFPRAFMDADVALSENVLCRVAEALNDPGVHLAAPECHHTYRGWNPLLAGYYQLWRSLPYVQRDTMARGFFAIDAELRSRFTDFPGLTADDKFIRNLTQPEERKIVAGCHTTVYMPATFRDLLRVKTRWTYGNLELAQRRPDLNQNDREPYRGAVRHVLQRPWLWVNVPTFMYVYWRSRRAARRQLHYGQTQWQRADSSRRGEHRLAH